jgi:hypothetical protein
MSSALERDESSVGGGEKDRAAAGRGAQRAAARPKSIIWEANSGLEGQTQR